MPFETATALLLMGQAVATVDLPPPPPPPPGARSSAELVVEPEDEADATAQEPKHVGPPPTVPSPPEDTDTSRHGEGFFFRQSAGVAFGALTLTTPTPEGEVETQLEAGLLNHELLLGGSPVRGFNLGARFAFAVAPGPGVVGDSSIRPDVGPLTFLMGALFVDVYPLPEEGLHFVGGGGMAIVHNAEPLGADEFVGAAWSLGVGYEFWVSSHWSMGVTTRIDGIWTEESDAESTSYDDDQVVLEALMPSLQLSMTYSSGS